MKRMMMAALAAMTAISGSADATVFNFKFDDIGGGGTGVFSTQKTLTAGTYKLSEVGTYSLDFTVLGGYNFTNSNIRTSAETVLLVVTGKVGALNMVFSNTKQYGDGPREGSLDLIGTKSFMSFNSPAAAAFDGADVYTAGVYGQRPFPARYSALQAPEAAVPEPASWAMMLLGFGIMGGALRYRRRVAKVTCA